MKQLNLNLTDKESLFNEYTQSNNPMEQAWIINQIRELYHIPYNELADSLYETERQLYRTVGLNKLIPELQQLVFEGSLIRKKAYAISALPELKQREIYHQFKDTFRRTKHLEFMKVLEKVAKRKR